MGSKGLCLIWMHQLWDIAVGPHLTPNECSTNVCNAKEEVNLEILNDTDDFLGIDTVCKAHP